MYGLLRVGEGRDWEYLRFIDVYNYIHTDSQYFTGTPRSFIVDL